MPQGKHAAIGRPTKFEPWMLRVSHKLYYLGATDEDVAEALDITRETVFQWAETNPKFSDTRKQKELADGDVERALHQRATGYTTEDGVHVPAHPTSQIFWLKNRKPKVWRDKTDVEHSGSVNIGTPEQSLQYLVQVATQNPVQNPVIRKWLKDCLAAIPPLEGGD